MNNLLINYFNHPNKLRAREIDLCLKRNVKNPHIDRIIVFTESVLPTNSHKITEIHILRRPTYQDFFDLTRDYDNNDVNVIANSDIYFNETFKAFDNINTNTCYALTRHEFLKGKIVDFFSANNCPPHYSQDVWAFRGHVKVRNCDRVIAQNLRNNNFEEIPFNLGVPGCDNVIANRLSSVYALKNPYSLIKCIHLHQEKTRPNYTHRMTGNKSKWGGLTRVNLSQL